MNASLKWLSLIFIVLQTTLSVILMRYSRTISTKTEYLSSTAVVMAEFIKLIIASIFYFRESNLPLNQKLFNLTKQFQLISVPGIIYAFQNNLIYIAISNLSATVFQVSYQLKIATTAVMSYLILGKRFSIYQILSLILLFLGVVIVQVTNSPSNSNNISKNQNQLLGLAVVIISSLTSAFAGVYTEAILKKGGKASLNLRNVQLSVVGLLMGLIVVLLKDFEVIIENGFFQGYNIIVWIVIFSQALGGLAIGVIMMYADNILKSFATSISIVLSSLLSIFIFDFRFTLGFTTGALLVIVSVIIYSAYPPNLQTKLPVN